MKDRILPGFNISLGITVFYLSILVLLPISGVVFSGINQNIGDFWNSVSSPRVLAAFKLSFGAALIAALINAIVGVMVAWVLVRYKFPGRRILDALVDLPFALPTAVAGIALTEIYAPNGIFGKVLMQFGIQGAFSQFGVLIALTFIGLPFVVRTVQPVLEDFEIEIEEAAASLGANRWQTFHKIILPALIPSIITGFTLAFARALGEYGSVVFIAGNVPLKTEIVPLLIMTKLEQFDYKGATALAMVMLLAAFALLLMINYLQSRLQMSKRN